MLTADDIVLPVVYTEASPLSLVSPSGWATEALLTGGVPLRDLWEIVTSLYEQVDDERDFYAEEAAAVIEKWMKSRESIPAAEVSLCDGQLYGMLMMQVEQFASAYLLRSRADDHDERKNETRRKLQAAKTAAQKF